MYPYTIQKTAISFNKKAHFFWLTRYINMSMYNNKRCSFPMDLYREIYIFNCSPDIVLYRTNIPPSMYTVYTVYTVYTPIFIHYVSVCMSMNTYFRSWAGILPEINIWKGERFHKTNGSKCLFFDLAPKCQLWFMHSHISRRSNWKITRGRVNCLFLISKTGRSSHKRHIYKPLCPTFGQSVHRSVCPSVRF